MTGSPQLRALDFYSGAGGATRGVQDAGFHVTGVDINPQPRYCGDAFFQEDALDFKWSWTGDFIGGSLAHFPEICDRCELTWARHFDFVWASPPCQAFSRLRHLHPKDRPNLIPQTRKLLVKSGAPYCIENVEEAPLGDSGYLIMLCGTMFGLQTADGRGELRRHRLFETSFSIPLRPACQHGTSSPLSICGKGDHLSARKVLTVCGHSPVDNVKRQTINVTGNGSPVGSDLYRHRQTLTVCGTGLDDNRMRARRRTISVTGSTAQANVVRNYVREVFTVQQAREAMGIDWMSMKYLSQAIPPAYSRFIAENFLKTVHFSGERNGREVSAEMSTDAMPEAHRLEAQNGKVLLSRMPAEGYPRDS
jgi:hypothetical protein